MCKKLKLTENNVLNKNVGENLSNSKQKYFNFFINISNTLKIIQNKDNSRGFKIFLA